MNRDKNEFDIYKYRNCFEDYADVESKEIIKNSVENPFFTIMIPTYLRGRILEKCIASALNQSFLGDYEVLIVNNDPNGIDNEVHKLVRSFNDKRISYYVNKKNIGMCGNWNRAIMLARAEHIVMLHDDNIIGPYALESIACVIKNQPKVQIIGLGIQDFEIDGDIPHFIKPKVIKCDMLTKKDFFFNRCLSIPGMCFKKELAISVGGFPDEYYPNEDTIFIYQGILNGEIININFLLSAYGRGDNVTIKGDTLKNIVLMTEKMRKSIAKNEKFAKNFMSTFGKTFLVDYIEGAERTWNIKLDRNDLLTKSGYSDSGVSKVSRVLMKSVIKMWNISERLFNDKVFTINMVCEEK